MTTTRLKLKVVPNASMDQIAGWLGDELKVRVSQPAEAGKANRRVESLIAEQLGVPIAAISVVAGARSARKTVEVRGMDPDEARTRLGAP